MRIGTRRGHLDVPAGNSRATQALLIASLAWIVLILAFYYRQLWSVIGEGPAAWDSPPLGQDLIATGLPHLREAASRGLSGVAGWMLVGLTVLGAGRLTGRWLLPQGLTPFERVAASFANGAACLSLGMLGLAGAGLYRPAVVRAVVAVSGIWTLILIAQDARRRYKHGQRLFPAFPRELSDRLWMAAALTAAAAAFVSALAPEVEFDALWYHLEMPRRWLTAGRPVSDVNEYVSLYPMNWDLLYGAALTVDGSVAARLLHWTAFVLAGGVAYAIGSRAFPGSGWIAAAIFVTAPTVLWEGSTAYVDAALALHAAVAGGALWMSVADPDRRWIALAGVNFGAACATKHLGIVVTAVAASVYVVAAARRIPLDRLARSILLLAVLSVSIPLPWYVRAWRASGNPVFPELYSVFGAAPPERWDELTERGVDGFKARFGRERTPANLLALPWDMTMHGARYGGTLGPFFLLLVPSLAVVISRQPAARWLLAACGLYLTVWASPVSSYQARFLVPWWVFMAPLVASAVRKFADAAGRYTRPGGNLAHLSLVCLTLLNLPPFTPLHEGDRREWTGWLTHVIRRLPIEVVAGGISGDRWLRSEIPTYGAWQYLNAHAPRDARVLTFFGGDHFYSERARLWSEAVAARPVTWGATSGDRQQVLERLASMNITYVLAPQPAARTPEQARLTVLHDDTTGTFGLEYADHCCVVYRVDARAR